MTLMQFREILENRWRRSACAVGDIILRWLRQEASEAPSYASSREPVALEPLLTLKFVAEIKNYKPVIHESEIQVFAGLTSR